MTNIDQLKKLEDILDDLYWVFARLGLGTEPVGYHIGVLETIVNQRIQELENHG